MNKFLLLSVSSFALFAMLSVTPTTVSAQSSALAYTPRTEAEKVAYLYGRISQLLEIQAELQRGGDISSLGNGSILFDYVTVKTHRAVEVEQTTAVLRGEVTLAGEVTASAWFEYGVDKNFLDQKTNRRNIRSAFDRAFRAPVSRLEDDKVYYFRVAALTKDDAVSYGSVFSFRTDEED